MLLSDRQITELCTRPSDTDTNWSPMIFPFTGRQVKEAINERVISYGVSSYGYDIRSSLSFKIFTNTHGIVVDPKMFSSRAFIDYKASRAGDSVIIPPNSFVLTHSLEAITMPDDVTGLVVGKSTLARVGIQTLCTPLEAGWKGYITLEFANSTTLPVMLYAGEGCCQILFFKGEKCTTTYRDRDGKYMDQPSEITTAKV